MINRVVLVGRLTRDPNLIQASSGTSLCRFTLAVDTWQKDTEGNRVTLFIDVRTFGQTADNVSKFARKGSLVGVDGRLTQSKFTRKDGTQASAIEVIADNVRFLEPKATGANNSQEAEPGFNQTPVEGSSNLGSVDITDIDDDVPF